MRAVIFTGGPDRIDDALGALRRSGALDGAFVIAADSGLALAQRAGVHVEVVVGDLDSTDPDVLARAVDDGARVERHPAEKDKTDLELAMDAALASGAQEVTVVGGDGGRLDHLLGNIAVLAADTYASMQVRACLGSAQVTVIRTKVELRGDVGSLVSLLAVGDRASGVRTAGLVYPLRDEALLAGGSRGVSNVFEAQTATVTVGSGVVVAVQP